MMSEERDFFVLHSSFIVHRSLPPLPMPLPPPNPGGFIPLNPRRRRKRRPALAQLPSAGVTVVSVEQMDAVSAVWRFSAPVVSVEDYSGLLIANQEPDALEELTSEGLLILLYSSGVSGDDPWSVG